MQLVHGSPNDEDEYVVSLGDALAPLITLTMPLTFFGHTHLQGGFFANGSSADGFRPEYRTVGQAESVPLQLKASAALSDQSGIGRAAARRRLARGVRTVRHRRAGRPLSPHAIQPERGAGSHLRGEASAAAGDTAGCGTVTASATPRSRSLQRTQSFQRNSLRIMSLFVRTNPPEHYLSAHSDGGARGNPGPAGYGVVIRTSPDERSPR